MPRYRLEINGNGCEIVFSSITKKTYNYWKNKDINDLSPEVAAADGHPQEEVFINNCDWSSADDLGHFEGPYFSYEAELSIWDESSKKVWSTELGEMNLPDELQESIDSDEFSVDATQHKFYFSGKRSLSGCFYSSDFEAKKFDYKKLGLSVIDVMGDTLLTGLTYDGAVIEIGQNDLISGDISLSVDVST